MLVNGSKLPEDKSRRPIAQALALRRAYAEQADALTRLPPPASPAEAYERARLAMQLGQAWERVQQRIERTSPQHRYRAKMRAKLAAAAGQSAKPLEVRPRTLPKARKVLAGSAGSGAQVLGSREPVPKTPEPNA